ncbi:MAG: electron transfer flavoprotein subunit beta/FixA family protein [Tissierellales bacterium]|nr:electron transfer flavoprotein subunit beta/FixA family protein [Tissierellales bacterium]MBN2827819.1 electron transfer flavoprotein subunit beta/FixA family protein [Tissierellales bacterium]
MNIVVPIKQVPETSNVKMDPETGTMIRDGVESIINPLDLYAIEIAIQLKEKFGGKVTAVTMGPPAANKALKEAIAMGCDEGVLVSDRKFAGADTWSTAYVLVKAIERIGEVDLVVAGERATDGDTGQVGPNIAAAMNLPLATYVSKVESLTENSMTVERLTEEGYEKLQLPLPALLTVVKEISYPRLPTLRGKQRAKITDIPTYTVADLDVEENNLGLKGSPTRVVKIETPKVTRGGKILKVVDDQSLNEAVDNLIAFMKMKEII